jgi:hypothetical protein
MNPLAIPSKIIRRLIATRAHLDAVGLVTPPEWEKHDHIKRWALETGYSTLVETGTYMGHTIEAVADSFQRVFTVEIDPVLAERAKNKFAVKKQVEVKSGSSIEVLPSILKQLSGPVIFWLDAHAKPGEVAPCPAREELKLVLAHPIKEHVIMFDDSRLFTGTVGWPSIKQIADEVYRNSPYQVRVWRDIIHIYRELR